MSNLGQVIISGIALLSALASGGNFLHVQSRRWGILMLPKMLANSLADYIVVVGAICFGLGIIVAAPLAVAAGLFATLVSGVYIIRVWASQDALEKSFSPGRLERLSLRPSHPVSPKHRVWWPSRLLEVRWERNLDFWAIPGCNRRLLCDLWRPALDTPCSGLAVIYLHSGEWHFADKDFGTRPLFRHLAEEGHVVMDVAYRLCPEVDVFEMLGDVKRAIAWMKQNADRFAVDPNRIVLAGGSAGGHLALLAAYTFDHPELIPEEIKTANLRVRGVVSYYGPPDLRAFFEDGYGKVNPSKKVKEISSNLLGGSPEQRLGLYQKGSPVTYIAPDRPPTLIFQGQHDCGVPRRSTLDFYHKLVNAGVPSFYVEFPQTEHGFDLHIRAIVAIAAKALHLPPVKSRWVDMSQYSPAARAARYNLDCFLALMCEEPGVSPVTHLCWP